MTPSQPPPQLSGQLPLQTASIKLAGLHEGRFDGRSEFTAAIRQGFAAAAEQGWRDIIISDASFDSWPLGERAVAQSLENWAKTGRTLTVLARNYDDVIRRHARFVTWRRRWAHLVICRVNTSVSEADFPSALWSAVWVCQRLDLVRSTGTASTEPGRRVVIKERLNECLRHSAPGFPASTLGL